MYLKNGRPFGQETVYVEISLHMMMRVIRRISHEIIEKNENVNDICLVGIKTRGVPLAGRISDCIYNIVVSYR